MFDQYAKYEPPSKRSTSKTSMVACVLFAALGTGAAPIPFFFHNKNFDPSYELAGTGSALGQPDETNNTNLYIPSITDMIESVTSDLKLSVTSFADIFNISRTAVYKWKEGGAIGSQNLQLLEGLYKISPKISELNMPLVSSKLSLPLDGGKSLVLALQKGEEPDLVFELWLNKIQSMNS